MIALSTVLKNARRGVKFESTAARCFGTPLVANKPVLRTNWKAWRAEQDALLLQQIGFPISLIPATQVSSIPTIPAATPAARTSSTYAPVNKYTTPGPTQLTTSQSLVGQKREMSLHLDRSYENCARNIERDMKFSQEISMVLWKYL